MGIRKEIIVIRSSVGGLGAAARPAARGHEMEIFKKRDKPCGCEYVYEIDRIAGRRREDYIAFVPLNPLYRIYDHRKQAFDYHENPEFSEGQKRKRNPACAAGYRWFLETAKPIFDKDFLQSADKMFSQSAGFRPHDRSEGYDHIYYVGTGTRPGGGVTGVFSPAVIADRRITDAGQGE